VAKIIAVPVTSEDFLIQGRLDAYRADLTEQLAELDRLVREVMEKVNIEKLEGKGQINYRTLPPTWTLTWRTKKGTFDATLMAFAQGGAWVIHGRRGLDRPFRARPELYPRDKRFIQAEVEGQIRSETVSF
jgi:hypothetical protein